MLLIYYWWLYSVMTPIVIFDMIRAASPFPRRAWPVGMEDLVHGQAELNPAFRDTVTIYPLPPSA
jgi:hypothetical protein